MYTKISIRSLGVVRIFGIGWSMIDEVWKIAKYIQYIHTAVPRKCECLCNPEAIGRLSNIVEKRLEKLGCHHVRWWWWLLRSFIFDIHPAKSETPEKWIFFYRICVFYVLVIVWEITVYICSQEKISESINCNIGPGCSWMMTIFCICKVMLFQLKILFKSTYHSNLKN